MTTFVNFKAMPAKRPGGASALFGRLGRVMPAKVCAVGVVLSRSVAVVVKPAAGSGSGSGSGGGGALPLPAAWLAVALPAGFICPLLGQLAMARGEAAAYSTQDKTLTIGGRVLMGTAGKVFEFKTQAAADMWLSVNAAKVQKELAALAGLPPYSLASWKAQKIGRMQGRAETITANAARMQDTAKRAALTAEAGFYSTKWS